MRTTAQPDVTGNKLLATLPSPDRERVAKLLRPAKLVAGRVVHAPGTVRRTVYFPVDCVFSKQFLTAAGDAAEVASVGNEGLVGVPLLLGSTGTPLQSVVEVAGMAWCGDGASLRAEFTRSGAFQNLVLRFTQALMTQIGQNAVCYQHHSAEQQFCLWLLLALDRAHSNHLQVSQERVGQTLGMRRESINGIVQRLARNGIIRHTRGHLEVLDRPQLEQRCCECYAVINREYARLLS